MTSSLFVLYLLCMSISLTMQQNIMGGNQRVKDRSKCVTVRCPPQAPHCVIQRRAPKCIPLSSFGRAHSTGRTRMGNKNAFLYRPIFRLGSIVHKSNDTRNNTTDNIVPTISTGSKISIKETSIPDYCREKFETGLCRAYFQRHYFDPHLGRCLPFVYGGCGGNKNNFKTERACILACSDPGSKTNKLDNGHQVKPIPPPPLSVLNRTTASTSKTSSMLVLNDTTGQGGQFFKRLSFCEDAVDRGHCFGFAPRFYFDKNSQQCMGFIYSGCGGNRNNFISRISCERMCPSTQINLTSTSIDTNFAYLPIYCKELPSLGTCRARFVRYYFNTITHHCQRFIYSGCGGNSNNHMTYSSCYHRCQTLISEPRQINDTHASNVSTTTTTTTTTTVAPIQTTLSLTTMPTQETSTIPAVHFCLLPKEVGPCRALVPRFFFNTASNHCEQFSYGGCKPNKNNFKSIRDCKAECETRFGIHDKVEFIDSRKIKGRGFGEVNSPRVGRLREFNPIDSSIFREFLMKQQANNDVTFIRPHASDFSVCTLPLNKGACSNRKLNYFFNAAKRTCQSFIYRGCGGNRNRFPSLQSCRETCIIKINNRAVRIP